MAHVLLPCDLPSWTSAQKYLEELKNCQLQDQLVQLLQKLFELCCISLDPDDRPSMSPEVRRFEGLRHYLQQYMTQEGRSEFYDETLNVIVEHALKLKNVKPSTGLQYCLQQQDACVDLSGRVVLSLMSCSFFSMFPRRTSKTHPTLNNFNFSNFFQCLPRSEKQRQKLRDILDYFKDVDDASDATSVRYCRRVDERLPTMHDWLSCDEQLCDVKLTEDEWNMRRLNVTHVGFTSQLAGSNVLADSESQVAELMCKNPYLLLSMLFFESLADNEVLTIHRFGSGCCSTGAQPDVSYVLMDALDFRRTPEMQYTEPSLLRELNKCLLAFNDPLLHRIRSDDRQRSTDSGNDSFNANRLSSSEDRSDVDLERIVVESIGDDRRNCTLTPSNRNVTAEESSPVTVDVDVGDHTTSPEQVDMKFDAIDPWHCEPEVGCQQFPDSVLDSQDITFREAADAEVTVCPSDVDSSMIIPERDASPEVEILKSTSSASFYTCKSEPMSDGDDSSSSYHSALDLSDIDEPVTTDDLSTAASRHLLADTLTSLLSSARRRSDDDDDDIFKRSDSHDRPSYSVNIEIQAPEIRDDRDIYRLSRTSSRGFVLDGSEGGGDKDDDCFEIHKHSDLQSGTTEGRRRLFQGRRLSSRMNSVDSRYSTDVDDDDDDDEEDDYATYTGDACRFSMIRRANSEPSLPSMTSSPNFGVEKDLMTIARRLQTAHYGHPANYVTDVIGCKLKSYSFDGVNANLPIPFKARFRKRKPVKNRRNDLQISPPRVTYSPLRMKSAANRRRRLYLRSNSSSLAKGVGSLSTDILEEESEECRDDESADKKANRLSGNITSMTINQRLSEIKQIISLRRPSQSVVETVLAVQRPEQNDDGGGRSNRKLFYMQSEDAPDFHLESDEEEFDADFMKNLEIKTAALSSSQEISSRFSPRIVDRNKDVNEMIQRPTSLSSLQKGVVYKTGDGAEDDGGALRKWKAATNLTDLLNQFSDDDDDDDDDDETVEVRWSDGSPTIDDLPDDLTDLYDSIADEIVFDAFCDAFLVLTDTVSQSKPKPEMDGSKSNEPPITEVDGSKSDEPPITEVDGSKSDEPPITEVDSTERRLHDDNDADVKERTEPELTANMDDDRITESMARHSKPIMTGNWGCGRQCADVQIKSVIQWLAASRARAPLVIYHTFGNQQVQKFNVIVRTLHRRQWTVSDLLTALLSYCRTYLNLRKSSNPQVAPVPFFVYLLDCATRQRSSDCISEDSVDYHSNSAKSATSSTK